MTDTSRLLLAIMGGLFAILAAGAAAGAYPRSFGDGPIWVAQPTAWPAALGLAAFAAAHLWAAFGQSSAAEAVRIPIAVVGIIGSLLVIAGTPVVGIPLAAVYLYVLLRAA